MAQGNQGGRQNNGGQQHQQMRENEVITAHETIKQVLRELNSRGKELRPVLPQDIPFDGFLANVNTALRTNPDLLQCSFDSIVNACVKAAYDGLRIDGREAALVVAEESYKEGSQWKKRKVARYMPMVFGLIKQILDCGAALAVKAVIVYREEARTGRFKLLEGTVQGIHHEPILEGDKGDMIGAYAIATITPGVFKFEWMDKVAIEDVQAESRTDKVWKRWPTEMWKKTAIRRLRKTLNGTSRIIDMEAKELFPQFAQSTHPQLGHNQQSSMPARPTREGSAQLEHDNSQPFSDFGGNDERERQPVEQSRSAQGQRDDRQEQRQQEQKSQRNDPKRAEPELPADDMEWGVWDVEMKGLIGKAKSIEALQELQEKHLPTIDVAPKRFQDAVTQAFTDRAADVAAGPGDGAAADDGQGNTAAGDE